MNDLERKNLIRYMREKRDQAKEEGRVICESFSHREMCEIVTALEMRAAALDQPLRKLPE